MSEIFTYLAPAKINLTLRVLGRLPDGYHELDTWMHKVALFDEISLQRSTGSHISLSCPDSDLPEDESNLVFKAAQCFFRMIGESSSLNIILRKKIPVSAGLGGGSSDCATVLTGLNEMFGKPVDLDVLCAEGKKLGADVPFFVKNFASARARGIGEYLSPLPALPSCHIILVNPGIAVSTGWVFSKLQGKIPVLEHYLYDSQKTAKNSNYALTRESKTYNLGRKSGVGEMPILFNDLEAVTEDHYPEIAHIKKIILKHNAVDTLMSGSGSTVFGIFSDINYAINCKNTIQSSHQDWHVFLTEPYIV